MRTLPVKTVRIALDGDYEGWWAEFRTNPPVGPLIDAMSAFQSADVNKIDTILPPLIDMLEQVIFKWNFVDEKGNELPCDKAGMRRLPLDLLMMLGNKVSEVVAQIPLAKSTG